MGLLLYMYLPRRLVVFFPVGIEDLLQEFLSQRYYHVPDCKTYKAFCWLSGFFAYRDRIFLVLGVLVDYAVEIPGKGERGGCEAQDQEEGYEF